MTLMALLVALLCVSSYIIIPLPLASISTHTLVVNLMGLLLSPGKAALCVLVWMLLGLCGVPVFTGGTSGLARLLGPSGGYWMAWIVAAVLISLLKGKQFSFKRFLSCCIFIGIPVIYLGGALWMKFTVGIHDLNKLLVASVIPFIPGDLLKCFLASVLARAVIRARGRRES